LLEVCTTSWGIPFVILVEPRCSVFTRRYELNLWL